MFVIANTAIGCLINLDLTSLACLPSISCEKSFLSNSSFSNTCVANLPLLTVAVTAYHGTIALIAFFDILFYMLGSQSALKLLVLLSHMNVMRSPCPVDSMRDAILTVSPKRQYLGILSPTTAAKHGPIHRAQQQRQLTRAKLQRINKRSRQTIVIFCRSPGEIGIRM